MHKFIFWVRRIMIFLMLWVSLVLVASGVFFAIFSQIAYDVLVCETFVSFFLALGLYSFFVKLKGIWDEAT